MKTQFMRGLYAVTVALSSVAALAQTTPLPQVSGEIRRVDREAGKLTIRHDQIPNLDMPAMTMVFTAAPGLLQQAQPGQQVSFTAERVQGALTVTSLRLRDTTR